MDGNVPNEAEAPAPELETTAAPEPADTETPETQAEEPVEQADEANAAKTFSQEELDAIVGKRLAREQRKWEREQARRQEEQAARQQPDGQLTPDQFESYEAYAEALAERKAEELLARREAERQQWGLQDAYQEREEAARDRYDDFEQVAYNPNLAVTDAMAKAIQASEVGPEVLYWLGTNPTEASRVARLDPLLQAREIGRIESRVAAEPPVKKTTKAPAPIAPVAGRASGAPAFDTTDPRSTKSMSASEWIEAERLRQIKKYEALRNR